MTNMITCQNISLSFKNNILFEDFSFHIYENEFVTLSGESGKGKSTLLKMIQGYVIPDKGSVCVNNVELNDKNLMELRQMITFIPQNINLPVNTGKELSELMNILDKEKDIKYYMQLLGLDESFYQQNFQKISGGQKQRIVISICLSMDKPVILLDEPTSSLDEASIKKLLETMRSLKNKTIISASHNATWLQNCDRTIVI